jgi:hypothetical protein
MEPYHLTAILSIADIVDDAPRGRLVIAASVILDSILRHACGDYRHGRTKVWGRVQLTALRGTASFLDDIDDYQIDFLKTPVAPGDLVAVFKVRIRELPLA